MDSRREVWGRPAVAPPRIHMGTCISADGSGDPGWLLEDLLTRAPGARHILVLSGDGLKLASTSGLDTDQADHLAALASGIQSLAHSASLVFGSGHGAAQAMVEFAGGLLLVAPAGDGAHLAVLADDDADVGLIGHSMHEFVEQIGGHLTAPARESGPPGARVP